MQRNAGVTGLLLEPYVNLVRQRENNLPRKVLPPLQATALRRLKSIHIETKSH